MKIFKLKGRKPWKLVLQIFKIVLITAQATWFAVDLQSVVSFDTDNLATFRHIFIKDYLYKLRSVLFFVCHVVRVVAIELGGSLRSHVFCGGSPGLEARSFPFLDPLFLPMWLAESYR